MITLAGEPGVTVERDVPLEMRDGVTLRADVYRPVGEGPWPVILMRLPYDKTGAENITYAHPSWYCRHGYVVVVQDCRGRWASDGEWYPFRDEAEDGYDTIEWAARLPGSNGRVGMYGFSYAGATQLLPATKRPPSLVCICPALTGSQYHEGWTYTAGAFNLAFAASWATDLATGIARGRRDGAEMARLTGAMAGIAGSFHALPLLPFPGLEGETAPYFADWLAHPTNDDYWRRWSIEEDYSRVDVPALHVAGWYDVFLSGTVRNFAGLREGAGSEEARENQRLLIGPWYHMPWFPLDGDDGEPADHTVVDLWQIGWFERHLKGRAIPLPEEPVTAYIMGEGRWRDFDAWPPSRSTLLPLYLHSGGSANSSHGDGLLSPTFPGAEPPDVFTYDPFHPTMSQGGQSCCYPWISPMGPADQGPGERWNSVLVYTSPPFDEDIHFVGDARVTLYAATDAVDTDWTARLCEVDADGRSTNIKAGIVRARYRDSLTEPTPLEPGAVYRYEIDLGPIGTMIRTGHSLRVDIASSDFPHWDRNLNTGGELFAEPLSAAKVATQTVLHDAEHPSCVWLPTLSFDEEGGA